MEQFTMQQTQAQPESGNNVKTVTVSPLEAGAVAGLAAYGAIRLIKVGYNKVRELTAAAKLLKQQQAPVQGQQAQAQPSQPQTPPQQAPAQGQPQQ